MGRANRSPKTQREGNAAPESRAAQHSACRPISRRPLHCTSVSQFRDHFYVQYGVLKFFELSVSIELRPFMVE